MKVRSTEKTNWSIEGFILEPGKIIDLPKNMEAKVERFIKAGLITVVDPDDSEKIDPVVKVESVPEQSKIVEKRVNLLNPTEEIYIEKTDKLNVIIKDGIEEKPSKPLTPKSQKQEVQSTEDEQSVLVVDKGEDNLEDGFVVLGKKTPGDGHAISTAKYIESQTDSIKQILADTLQDMSKLQEEEPKAIVEIPERTQVILEQEANKRKMFIAQLKDKEFLLEIAKCTHDKNIQSIINQRLEELK